MGCMTTSQTPIAMTIAGSEATGGAGAQADLKTFQALGVYGCLALTCIVSFDPKNGWAHRLTPVDQQTLRDQLEVNTCLLYTSPSPRDRQKSRMPSSA